MGSSLPLPENASLISAMTGTRLVITSTQTRLALSRLHCAFNLFQVEKGLEKRRACSVWYDYSCCIIVEASPDSRPTCAFSHRGTVSVILGRAS